MVISINILVFFNNGVLFAEILSGFYKNWVTSIEIKVNQSITHTISARVLIQSFSVHLIPRRTDVRIEKISLANGANIQIVATNVFFGYIEMSNTRETLVL